MLRAPTTESKERSQASRTAKAPEPQRELHPGSHIGVHGGETGSGPARLRQHFAGLQQTIGNHAVLRMLSHSGLTIQTKLTVNQPGDQYEQEADRVAEQVMRMPDSHFAPGFPSAGERPQPGLQRTCSCGGSGGECSCKEKHEEELLQRKPHEASAAKTSAPAALDGIPPIVHQVLGSPGQPLDAASRAFFEPRFGRDFGQVRVHTDATAAQSAKAVNALAYTLGPNIVFGHGQFALTTAAGKTLLAHELTHTIQQSHDSSGLPSGIANPGNFLQHKADTPAAGVLDGRDTIGSSVQLHSAGPCLQRFGSEEHVKIGDIAEPGKMVVISGYGSVRLGELIAMAGDYFESITQLENVAHQGTFGTQQIDLVRWKVNGSAGPKPTVGTGVEEAVNSRYEDLAARNQTHFSTGSSPGNSNRERYIDLHTQAIQAGFVAGAFAQGRTSAFPPHIPEALEGFAEHFLTDAFSAGHVRTPRGELQTFWGAKFPNFKANLLEFISCNMATYIHDVDHPDFHGIPLSVGQIKDGVHVGPIDRNGVRDVIKSKAGDKLDRFSLGDLISKALHDADSRGLDVTSASDVAGGTKPFKWRAVGDEKLFPSTADPASTTTQNMVEAAVKLSFGEEEQAVKAGMGSSSASLAQMTNPAGYRALPLIPSEDTSSKTNPTYSWRVNDVPSLPTNVKDIIKDEFKPGTAISTGLNAVGVDPCTASIHSGTAWDCLKQVLLADPIDALDRVSQGRTCPASNPCPGLRPAAPCP